MKPPITRELIFNFTRNAPRLAGAMHFTMTSPNLWPFYEPLDPSGLEPRFNIKVREVVVRRSGTWAELMNDLECRACGNTDKFAMLPNQSIICLGLIDSNEVDALNIPIQIQCGSGRVFSS